MSGNDRLHNGHIDEGAIHAWLDGELSPGESAALELHLGSCARCTEAVAEARGLLAASSRILSALDDVQRVGDVGETRGEDVLRRRSRRSAWGSRTPWRAMAATLLLAAGVGTLWRLVPWERERTATAATDVSASTMAAAAPASAPASAPAAATLSSPSAVEPDAPSRESRESRAPAKAAPPRPRELAPTIASAPMAEQARARRTDAAKSANLGVSAEPGRAAPPMPSVASALGGTVVAPMAASITSSAANTASNGARLTGFVRDSASGRPLIGASVLIPGAASSISDSTGRFELRGVPAGAHSVIVRRIGYRAERESLTVRVGDERALDVVLSAMPPQMLAATVLRNESTSVAPRAALGSSARVSADAAPSSSRGASPRPELAFAGCYQLTLGSWMEGAPPVSAYELPRRIVLDAEPAPSNGAGFVLRAEGKENEGIVAHVWLLTPPRFSGDAASVTLRWGAPFDGLVMEMRQEASDLRGTATVRSAERVHRAYVTAKRAICRR